MNERNGMNIGYGAIVTAVAALLVYVGALGNEFAFDDVAVIPNDPRIVNAQITELFTRPYWVNTALGLYRPFTSLTFALDWFASGGTAAWFHFTNLVWHMLASVLAYALLLKFFRPVAALAGGLIFALHPVHVEAVANVVGRSELIAATFFFAACLVWSTRALSALTRSLLAAVCFTFALFAKESAITLPAVLLLIDAVQSDSRLTGLWRRWLEYVPLVVVAIVFVVIRWNVVGGIAPASVDPSLDLATTTPLRLLTALQAWPVYVKLLFFPRTLLADYGPRILMPLNGWTPSATLGLTIVVASLIGSAVALARGERLWGLGLLWFPITILPVSNFFFPIGVVVAERTLYLPSFALCIGVAALVSQPAVITYRHTRVVLAAVLILLAVRTLARVPEWKTTDTVMAALMRDRPDAFRAHWYSARTARTAGDVNGSLAYYDRALRLWPYREGLVHEAAIYASSQGRVAWAQELVERGVQRWPRNVTLQQMHVGYALDRGDTATARRALVRALQLHPGDTLLNKMLRSLAPVQP